MLSAKELFKYRTGLEKTMPPKGGDKEYMPDGSWLQDKCIESFHRERERVLSEPRVVRSHDLVKGEWKPDIGLLELFHEMKNFWEHMGFVDNKRKWLYPEEALFLIETGILEMWYQELPLSIQEAYSTLIGNKIHLEYYQVYAHLRRIGYVVLRHQGRYEFTKYERHIGLDKHVSHKKKRNKEKRNKSKISGQSIDVAEIKVGDQSMDVAEIKVGDQSMDVAEIKADYQSMDVAEIIKVGDQSMDVAEIRVGDQSMDVAQTKVGDQSMDVAQTKFGGQSMDVFQVGRKIPNDRTGKSEADPEGRVTDRSNDRPAVNKTDDKFDQMSDGDKQKVMKNIPLKEESENESKRPKTDDLFETIEYPNRAAQSSNSLEDEFVLETQTKLTKWNFDEIKFPNFKNTEERVLVNKPDINFIPQDREVIFREFEYSFDKKQYINTKKLKKKQQMLDKALVQELDFSYPEIMTGWHKVKRSCTNWKEYKMAVKKEKASWDRSTVLPHLYGDKVKPLVKPELARSTYSVLEQLRVVEDDMQKKCDIKPAVLPDFDVYAPNSKFKKSKPGVPDFRVKVVRMCDPIPDLKLVGSINSYLNDEAALQWAVVDCGNISFNSMSDMHLPLDISLG